MNSDSKCDFTFSTDSNCDSFSRTNLSFNVKANYDTKFWYKASPNFSSNSNPKLKLNNDNNQLINPT